MWDKERKELHYQIQTIQITMKNLQSQMAQRTSNHNIQADVTSSNQDAVQSVQGENEFLKNRIKEVSDLRHRLFWQPRYKRLFATRWK